MRIDISPKVKEKLRLLPHKPGVYIFRNASGRILYVGKAKVLKQRVSSYFRSPERLFTERPKLKMLVQLIEDIDHIETRSENEALILESRLIKDWKPKYNQELVDDKGYWFLEVQTQQRFPTFRLVHRATMAQAQYFGPFIQGHFLRTLLQDMKFRFGILVGKIAPQLVEKEDGAQNRYRLFEDARGQLYGHSNEVSPAEYHSRVQAACEFLGSQQQAWVTYLQEQMSQAAQRLDFEQAAQWRDCLQLIQKGGKIGPAARLTQERLIEPNLNTAEALSELQNCLKLPDLPTHIECFDISHISGTFTVASMVCFMQGKPAKKHYRRFRIRFEADPPGTLHAFREAPVGFSALSANTQQPFQPYASPGPDLGHPAYYNDDYRAMQQVVFRHYRSLLAQSSSLPGLVLIDGGKGQVRAAAQAFETLGIPPPPLIGLAKKQELILTLADPEPLELPRHSSALRLLQRIRDEAHRFANQFNQELRRQRLAESVLDECTGLGPAKKQALLQHFGNIHGIQKATPEALQHVKGISHQLALRLYETLHGAAHTGPADPNPR